MLPPIYDQPLEKKIITDSLPLVIEGEVRINKKFDHKMQPLLPIEGLILMDGDDDILLSAKCEGEMAISRKRDRGGEFRPVFLSRRKGCQTCTYRKATHFFITRTSIND